MISTVFGTNRSWKSYYVSNLIRLVSFSKPLFMLEDAENKPRRARTSLVMTTPMRMKSTQKYTSAKLNQPRKVGIDKKLIKLPVHCCIVAREFLAKSLLQWQVRENPKLLLVSRARNEVTRLKMGRTKM